MKLQQRCTLWSGLLDTSRPPEYRMKGKCAPRFQLAGRMTSCADLTRATGNLEADNPARASGAGHYFKSSWPEDDRRKEGQIIHIAKRRAHVFLPPPFRPFVLNHLPEVRETLLVPQTCTAIIRILLNLPTQGSRTQYLMISKKLSSVRNIVHDTSFKRVLLEIIRGKFHFLSSWIRWF